MSFLLSIPGSNAFFERTFSLMNAKWRDDRNRMSMVLVTAELQVYRNYTFYCCFFYKFALQNHKLLEAAGSNDKYTWKNKPKTQK
jgi:hypothetical protein